MMLAAIHDDCVVYNVTAEVKYRANAAAAATILRWGCILIGGDAGLL